MGRQSDAISGRIVITGGSGFLGLAVAEDLCSRGAGVTIASRSRPAAGPWRHAPWDGRSVGAWADALEGAAAVINLAGRTVDCVKTPDHCDEILRSRVESTRAVGAACRRLLDDGRRPPPVWVQAGTAHIYGDPPTAVCDEDSAFGYGLAPDVATAWEAAFEEARLPSQRGVILRTSFVIGRDRGGGGGALATLGRLARCGLGGRVGHGRQGFSWLHEADFCGVVRRAIEDASMEGPYIVSSPNPVSQAEFMTAVRRAVGMPIGLPAPAWLVRLGARFVLRTDPELALYGRYVVPRRLLNEGFEFTWPDVGPAVADLVNSPRPR